jgi:hypothetical protein
MPFVIGRKVILIKQFAPASRLALQVMFSTKLFLSAPVIEMLTLTGRVALLVSPIILGTQSALTC